MFVADFVKRVGGFLNLNELEFSDTNATELKKRGYVLKDNESNTVKGSAEIAKKVFDGFDCQTRLNFCSSRYKDAVQLRLRLLRTAQSYARPFDEITPDGTILFGKIKVKAQEIDFITELFEKYELPEESYFVNVEKNIIETAAGIAEELSMIFNEEEFEEPKDIQIWIIEQYPFTDGFVVDSERIY